MVNLHIRIDATYEVIKPFFDKVITTKGIVYEHPFNPKTGKPIHCHAWVYDVGVSTDTLKNWVNKLIPDFPGHDAWYFKEKTSKKHGCKPWTDDVITYMSKGKLDPKYNVGFADEIVNDFKSKWVSQENPITTQDGKLVVKREVKETKKKTKRELIQEMLETYLPEMENHEIIELIRKVLIKNNEVIGMYKVIDYYDALLCYGNKEEFVRMIVQKINSRIRV